MISSLTDCRDKVAFKVQGDNFLLVSLSTSDELDISTSGELPSVKRLILSDILSGSHLGNIEKDSQVELREKSTLVEGLTGPTFYSSHSDFSVLREIFDGFDVGVADDVEDNGLEFGLSHFFTLLRILVYRDSVPDHLALLDEGVVVVAVILLDDGKEIIDDSRGGDGSFVIAIVVHEAIEKDVLERFTLEPIIPSKGDRFFGLADGVPGQKGQIMVIHRVRPLFFWS